MNVILSPLYRSSKRFTSSMRFTLAIALLTVSLAGLNGCKSKEDAALEQAKKLAASTGQAQQVIYTDADGNTVTSTVQPPVAGQTGQVVTTTVTPKGASPDAAVAVQSADTTAPAPAAPVAAPVATPAAPRAAAPAPAPKPVPVKAAPPAPASTPIVKPAPPPDLRIAAGTPLSVRIDQRITSKESRPGDGFTGELTQPVTVGNIIAIPKGAQVAGVVNGAQKRGNFKGAASLDLTLTSVTLRGRSYQLDTTDVSRSQKGKGKRTGAFIGGGAGLGALIGGLAGGGKGALIGGLAGAGAGTAGAGLTGNGDLVIPAESVVRFELADDLVVPQ